jgi:hypothetical protein
MDFKVSNSFLVIGSILLLLLSSIVKCFEFLFISVYFLWFSLSHLLLIFFNEFATFCFFCFYIAVVSFGLCIYITKSLCTTKQHVVLCH